MKTDNIYIALTAALLLTASCANEDATQTDEQRQEQKIRNYTVFMSGKEDTNTEQDKTRTSLNYNTGAFYWETGDNIFVKDDDGTWQTSANAISGTEITYHRFQLSGSFTGTSYNVFYPGRNGINDQAVIATAQTQTEPANTKHLGEAGDCGLATATGSSNGFSFKLDHKATILVFQPYTNNALLKDCYLTKIEVLSDNNIAGTYTLDPTTKSLTGTGNSKTITLTTKASSGTYQNGFPMNTTSASLTTNGAYMVIAPGYHKLRIRFWLKSLVDNVEGTITKELPNFNYEKNNYYDMTANLTITDYPGNEYYQWDAQQNYWAGYEWNSANPKQPTIDGQQNTVDAPKSTNAISTHTVRDFNDLMGYNDPSGTAAVVLPATERFKSFPNVNELLWYAKKGDPHWDNELWSTMRHLYAGGIWLKKQDKINNYSKNHAPDETTDYTRSTVNVDYNSSSVGFIIPTGKPTNHDDYFFLPARGSYGNGITFFSYMGVRFGTYWSSTPSPMGTNRAYGLYFDRSNITVRYIHLRYNGFPLWPAR